MQGGRAGRVRVVDQALGRVGHDGVGRGLSHILVAGKKRERPYKGKVGTVVVRL